MQNRHTQPCVLQVRAPACVAVGACGGVLEYLGSGVGVEHGVRLGVTRKNRLLGYL